MSAQRRSIYNNTACRVEVLTRQQCPRCKGFGACAKDDDTCDVCKGKGSLWVGTSGVTVALGETADKQRYY